MDVLKPNPEPIIDLTNVSDPIKKRLLDQARTIKCRGCEIFTSSKLVFIQHLDICKKRLNCDNCCGELRSSRLLDEQTSRENLASASDSGGEMFMCEHCSYSTSLRMSLKRHYEMVHEYRCEYCPFNARTQARTTRSSTRISSLRNNRHRKCQVQPTDCNKQHRNSNIRRKKCKIQQGKKGLVTINGVEQVTGPSHLRANHCPFCFRRVTHFSRHLRRFHKDKDEVKMFAAMPPKSLKRLQMITVLRKRGNYLFFSKSNVIRPVRMMRQLGKENYEPCPDCYGLFQADYLYRHRQRCLQRPKDSVLHKRRSTVADKFPVCGGGNQKFYDSLRIKDLVFICLRVDERSRVAISDVLICSYAESLLGLLTKSTLRMNIANRMRQLGRLLIALKQSCGVKQLLDALTPEHFDDIVSATKVISGFDPETSKYKSETLPARMGYLLRKLCSVAIKLIKEENEFLRCNDPELTIKAVYQLRMRIYDHWGCCAFADLAQSKEDHPIRGVCRSRLKSGEGINNRRSSHDQDADYSPSEDLYDSEPIKKSLQTTRSKKRKSGCPYCLQQLNNFARHLKRNHKEEDAVKELLALPRGDIRRKHMFEALRKRGNYLLFRSVGIRPVRLSRPQNRTKKFAVCTDCYGYYQKEYLYRHRATCRQRPKDQRNAKHLSEAQKHTICNGENKEFYDSLKLKDTVFVTMKADEISQVAMRDILICSYGETLVNVVKASRVSADIVGRMRQLGRLLHALREKFQVQCMLDALKPEHYNHIVMATKDISGFDPETATYSAESLPPALGRVLLHLCGTTVELLTKEYKFLECGDREKSIRDVTQLRRLVLRKWNSSLGFDCAKIRRKPNLLHVTNEMLTFQEYTTMEATAVWQCIEQQINISTRQYKILSESIFNLLLLVNRGRALYAEAVTVDNYTSNLSDSQQMDILRRLSEPEKIFTKNYKWVVTDDDVAILFPACLQKLIHAMLSVREKYVPKANKFLFAVPRSESKVMKGLCVLRRFLRRSEVINHGMFTSKRLAEELAIVLQVIYATAEDLEEFATLMGHTKEEGRPEFCRLPLDAPQIAKLTKLILAVKRGQGDQYKGKTLEEIDFLDDMEASTTKLETLEDGSSNVNGEKVDDPNSTQQESIEGRISPLTDDEDDNIVRKRKKHQRAKWSDLERRIVASYFSYHIKNKKNPKKSEVDDFRIQHRPLFKDKDWVKIKTYVFNCHRTQSEFLVPAGGVEKVGKYITKQEKSGNVDEAKEKHNEESSSNVDLDESHLDSLSNGIKEQDVSTTGEVSISSPTSTSADNSPDKGNSNKKKHNRRKWSEEEKRVVISCFRDHIKQKIAPKKAEVEQFLDDHKQTFKDKDWVKIKTFVYNYYRTGIELPPPRSEDVAEVVVRPKRKQQEQQKQQQEQQPKVDLSDIVDLVEGESESDTDAANGKRNTSTRAGHAMKTYATRCKWTEEEKSVVSAYFRDHILSQTAPKRKEVEELIAKHGQLFKDKDWVKIKTYVYNCYRARLELQASVENKEEAVDQKEIEVNGEEKDANENEDVSEGGEEHNGAEFPGNVGLEHSVFGPELDTVQQNIATERDNIDLVKHTNLGKMNLGKLKNFENVKIRIKRKFLNNYTQCTSSHPPNYAIVYTVPEKNKRGNANREINKGERNAARSRWTQAEKSLVESYFEDHISKKVPPKKGEVEKFIIQHGEVISQDKDWVKIKTYVYNCYKSRAKRSVPVEDAEETEDEAEEIEIEDDDANEEVEEEEEEDDDDNEEYDDASEEEDDDDDDGSDGMELPLNVEAHYSDSDEEMLHCLKQKNDESSTMGESSLPLTSTDAEDICTKSEVFVPFKEKEKGNESEGEQQHFMEINIKEEYVSEETLSTRKRKRSIPTYTGRVKKRKILGNELPEEETSCDRPRKQLVVLLERLAIVGDEAEKGKEENISGKEDSDSKEEDTNEKEEDNNRTEEDSNRTEEDSNRTEEDSNGKEEPIQQQHNAELPLNENLEESASENTSEKPVVYESSPSSTSSYAGHTKKKKKKEKRKIQETKLPEEGNGSCDRPLKELVVLVEKIVCVEDETVEQAEEEDPNGKEEQQAQVKEEQGKEEESNDKEKQQPTELSLNVVVHHSDSEGVRDTVTSKTSESSTVSDVSLPAIPASTGIVQSSTVPDVSPPAIPASTGIVQSSTVADVSLPGIPAGTGHTLKRKRTVQRCKWSEDEKDALNSFFKDHIVNRVAPKKVEVEELMTKYWPLFRDKDLSEIKTYVYNCYKTQTEPHVPVEREKEKEREQENVNEKIHKYVNIGGEGNVSGKETEEVNHSELNLIEEKQKYVNEDEKGEQHSTKCPPHEEDIHEVVDTAKTLPPVKETPIKTRRLSKDVSNSKRRRPSSS